LTQSNGRRKALRLLHIRDSGLNMYEDFEIRDDLDALIAQALGDEPMLAAPLTLHRRVEDRVRIIALKDKERARFRYTMTGFALALVASIATAAGVVVFTNFAEIMAHGVSGGRGQYDSMFAYAQVSLTNYSGAYSMILSMCLAFGTLLLGVFPLRNYIISHR